MGVRGFLSRAHEIGLEGNLIAGGSYIQHVADRPCAVGVARQLDLFKRAA